MRTLDRLLQAWRARMARPWISEGARVLDIGCHQGEFLQSLGERIGPSVGLDPLAQPRTTPRFELKSDLFREPAPFPDASFDAIVMLATLEHVPDKEPFARECFRLLRPGGRMIITVPARAVDHIIELLQKVRLVDGMSLEEHHGYDPLATPGIFARHGFTLERHKRFQLGLNHLFVLRR